MAVNPVFPTATKVFTTKTDLTNTVYADDMNTVQTEVVAIENVLGYNPHLSTFSTYTPAFGAAATVANRLALLEADLVARLQRLERLTLNASVGTYVGSSLPVGSSLNWQTLLFTQVDSTTTTDQIPGPPLYDNTSPSGTPTSRFYAVAVDQSAYTLACTLTWQPVSGGSPAGHRGVRIVGSDGRIFAQRRYLAITTDSDPDIMSLHWSGVLPVAATAPNTSYYLQLQVFNDSGQGLFLMADSITTPARADFYRIPG